MASIKVSLLADSKSLERGFKTSTKAAEKFNRSMGATGKVAAKQKSAFAGLGRTVVGLGAGYLGARGLISVVRASFEEMSQSAKVSAQTNAVLKSTGGVAGVTAGHVDRLGAALLRKSGIDDETVRSGENMILTFRNIRNSAGQGNDIFDQTTKATLDMDAAMTHGNVTQESLSKSAIRVGKALNDPIKGVTALRRVGVQFTESQTKQIAAMVKSGNVMGAQKLILKELNAEFGGSAAALGGTLPGKINILRESFRNLGGSLATGLVPGLTHAVDAGNKWVSNTENVKRVQNTFKQIVAGVTSVLRALRGVLNGVNTVTGSTTNTVKLLVGAFVAFKALSMAAAVRGVAASFFTLRTATAASTTAAQANTAVAGRNSLALGRGTTAGAAGFRKVGAAATVSTAKIAKVRVGMRGIGAAAARLTGAPYLITFALVAVGAKRVAAQIKALQEKKLDAKDAAPKKGEGLETTLVPALAKRIKAMKAAGKSGKEILAKLRKDLGGSLKADDLIGEAFAFSSGADPANKKRIEANVKKRVKKTADVTRKALATGATATTRPGITAEQRNSFFDAAIGRDINRVQDIAGTGGQLAALKKIADQVKARIAATKDITRKLTLEDQLLDITRQEKGLRADQAAAKQQARQAAAARRQEAADKRIAAAEKRRARIQSRQFFTLGLDATGGERVPFKKTLQRQLGTVSDAVKGTFLDTPKTRSLLARIRKVLKEGIVPTDVRAKVKEMLAGVSDELKNGTAGHTKFKKANTDAVLAGLGLSPKQIQALRGRLSQVGVGGTVHGTGVGAFGVALPATAGTSVVHTTINVDGQKMAVNTTKHQKQRRATSRRG